MLEGEGDGVKQCFSSSDEEEVQATEADEKKSSSEEGGCGVEDDVDAG